MGMIQAQASICICWYCLSALSDALHQFQVIYKSINRLDIRERVGATIHTVHLRWSQIESQDANFNLIYGWVCWKANQFWKHINHSLRDSWICTSDSLIPFDVQFHTNKSLQIDAYRPGAMQSFLQNTCYIHNVCV